MGVHKVLDFLYLLLVSVFLPWAMISGTVVYIAAHRTPMQTTLRLLTQSGVQVIKMEDYLTGVILAELPSVFPAEAVKAQCVAGRTYTMKRMEHSKHPDADICADSTCCQGYCAPEEYLAGGGSREFVALAQNAARDTAGEILCYDGQLIDAAYFSSAGGSTESAVEVWGADYPYLIAQPSPEEPRIRTYSFSEAELRQALGLPLEEPLLPEILSRTMGGGAEQVKIGGQVFSGLSLREKLGLCSTSFAIRQEGDSLVFEASGSGHRVGMSQYGAYTMANEGKNYIQILSYYYPGTKIHNSLVAKETKI